MNNFTVIFEPVPLLDKILIAAQIAPDEQEILLAGWRTLVRNRATEQMTHFLKEDGKLLSMLEEPSWDKITPETFAEQLTRFAEEIGQKIPQEKLQAIVAMIFLSSFLDVVNSLLGTVSPEKQEKINEILDQDLAFRTIYTAWQEANETDSPGI